MIQVYSWATPNGHKVHIMLEECGLPYREHAVDIGAGDQFAPEFLALGPNNKIPAIVDPDGPDGEPISLFESGAILLYLAAKTGLFLPASVRDKYEVLQWLMFQMGGVGPMLGQAHHFRLYAPERIPYAIDRYTNEARRLYGVMNKRLAKSRYIGGAEYSIADIAVFPWVRNLIGFYAAGELVGIENFAHVQRQWWTTRRARRCSARRSTGSAESGSGVMGAAPRIFRLLCP